MRNLKSIEEKIEKVRNLCQKREEIIALYIFGSYGTYEQTPLSDIDFAVSYGSIPKMEEELDFEVKISEIFEREDIDVIVLNRASVDLQIEVLSKGEIIYCRDEILFAEFKEKVFDQYADYEPILREFYEDVLEGIENDRNRLVHFYQEVDDKEVYRILENNLVDLERFVDFVEELVIKD